jgi:hypothetical protein
MRITRTAPRPRSTAGILNDEICREDFIANPPALLLAIVESSAVADAAEAEGEGGFRCVNDGREFANAGEAALAYGVTKRAIYKCVKSGKAFRNGLSFERLEK